MLRNDEVQRHTLLSEMITRVSGFSAWLLPSFAWSGGQSPPRLAPVWPSTARRRVIKMTVLVALFCLVTWTLCTRIPQYSTQGTQRPQQPEKTPHPHPQPEDAFPPTHATDLKIHDPSIIHVDGTYYSYSVGRHIRIHQAPSLDGPWERTGAVLNADSVIPKGDRKAPWAPQTVHHNDTYYCFYAVSNSGCRDSAIGVATSKSPGPGGWTDHGLLVQSGTGKGSDEHPFTSSNTIDPSVFVGEDGHGYLMFGSFWSGIWQVPLDESLLSVAGDTSSEARQLVYMEKAPLPASKHPNPLCREPSGARPIEGSFLSYHEPWYYLWFSYGKCCKFDTKNLPPPGREYSIRVGRSKSPRGPFVDKQGRDLANGGGEIVYASNRDVYAPGGQGVLTEKSGDILYYHYFQTHPLLHPVPFTPLIRTGLPPSHLTTVPLLRRPQRRQQRRQNNPQRHSHTIPAGSTFINRALPPRNSQRRPLSPFPFFPPTIPLRMLPVTQMQRALLPLNLKLKTRTEIQDADLAITEEETPPSRRVLVRV
ncbi:hypothetical protein LV157_001439 [Aspergillus fumigatus]|nr:hypothetical protein LV157_001439 [Aspergillus fumigatus]